MMIGEVARSNPTVQIPPWDPYDDLTAGVHSPYSVPSPTGDYLAALHRYLPSNEPDSLEPEQADPELLNEFLCDHFRMYVFKVRRCARGRSHDWTECPYAHPGEKARRRDPRRFQYSGTACPDFRKGVCKKGDSCEFAHGVFECWLHPDRYRTQPCKDGPNCRRRVCFFAHSPDQLRILPQQPSPGSVESDYSSPGRLGPDTHHLTKPGSFLSSPTSILTSPPISPPSDSPPMSPSGLNSVSELVSSMRGLSFGKAKLSQRAHFASGFGPTRCSTLRPGSYMGNLMPSTPTRSGLGGGFDLLESPFKEEPAMERVESGRDIRAKIYAKLSRENSLDLVDAPGSGPDVGWVSELVK
ncbi:zinc finger CCCH domain-containing protein 20-like [Punica granatum]|uniref:C3H1-type domain-containing protein n=2 Tax=Punica granatum TaxID=22663 RepID=A0A218XPH2_PUNGR|nr:zinc finger CCCH domain-containing protein 20-like [Punica granatum]OWM86589.1 hypothetical protein CDL15_Pgr015624 [Punica granatum]PKI67190.1 hypothetical protein CRG98_012439 [Punica granatum]